MKQKSISADIYIYLYPILAVVIILAISLFLTVPQAKKALEIYNGLAAKRDRVEILDEKLATLKGVDDQTLNTLGEVTLALPNEKDPASVMVGLDNLSAQSKLTIDTLEFSPLTVTESTGSKKTKTASTERPADAVEFVINTRGVNQSLHDFVNQALNTRRLMDIDSMGIEYDKDTADFVVGDMKMVAYYLTPLTQIGEVESRLPPLTEDEKQVLTGIGDLPYVSTISDVIYQGDFGEFVGKTDLFAP
jgi:hypothetical protein